MLKGKRNREFLLMALVADMAGKMRKPGSTVAGVEMPRNNTQAIDDTSDSRID